MRYTGIHIFITLHYLFRMPDDGQQSALLTPSQRQVLIDESDITDRGKRAARSRIRQRVRAGILDFGLLGGYLTSDDRDRIIEEIDYGDAIDPVISMVSFSYQICKTVGLDAEKIFGEGIARGEEARTGQRPGVDIDITIDPPTEVLFERYRRGDPTLTWAELDQIEEAYGIDIEHPAHSGEGGMGISEELEEELRDLDEE